MTGSAGRPNGSHVAPDGRSARDPESASFEVTRVPSRRSSPPILILGFLVLVGALVAVGVGGGSSSQPTLPPVALESPATVTAAPAAEPSPTSTPRPVLPDPSSGTVRSFFSDPGPIELQARRNAASMYIHGDIFVPQVTWVFVSLRDDAGRVAGWSSVSVPGAAGPARDKGPTLRFDVEMALPDGFSGRLWLNANAYDSEGALMTSTRLEIGPGTS